MRYGLEVYKVPVALTGFDWAFGNTSVMIAPGEKAPIFVLR